MNLLAGHHYHAIAHAEIRDVHVLDSAHIHAADLAGDAIAELANDNIAAAIRESANYECWICNDVWSGVVEFSPSEDVDSAKVDRSILAGLNHRLTNVSPEGRFRAHVRGTHYAQRGAESAALAQPFALVPLVGSVAGQGVIAAAGRFLRPDPEVLDLDTLAEGPAPVDWHPTVSASSVARPLGALNVNHDTGDRAYQERAHEALADSGIPTWQFYAAAVVVTIAVVGIAAGNAARLIGR